MCVATDYKLELKFLNKCWVHTTVQFSLYLFIMMSGLSFQNFLRGIHPSVLCPESVHQAHKLRLTKCQDSENDGHNAAMRTSRRKCVHWVLKMFINHNTILCGGKPQTLKFTYQQTAVVFTQMWSLFFLLQCNWDTKLIRTQDEVDSTVCNGTRKIL